MMKQKSGEQRSIKNNLGDILWYKIGTEILHRIDGPAIEYCDGSKAWYQKGQKHRFNGPAYEKINGYKEWWIKGKRHRIDGPAIEWFTDTPSGPHQYEFWYVNNQHYHDAISAKYAIAKWICHAQN